MVLLPSASEGMVHVKLPLADGMGTEKSCLVILLFVGR